MENANVDFDSISIENISTVEETTQPKTRTPEQWGILRVIVTLKESVMYLNADNN